MVKRWQDLSILIVGCGSIGKRHARVLRSLGCTDIRACDPLPSQRAALQAESPDVALYESYEDGLAEAPETVLICTPPRLHIPMALQASASGAHVFCEKPLSDSSAGIDELAAETTHRGTKVMVGLCFRYHDGLVRAKQQLESGRIGRLVSVRAMVGEHLPDVRPDYRNLFSARYSGAFDLMHDIDLAIWYASRPVTAVSSMSGNYSDIGIEAPDVAEILIGFGGHCLASVHLDFFQRPRRRQIELLGTDGVIVVEFGRWDTCTVSMYQASAGRWEVEEMATERDDMFRAEDREFLVAVAEDKPISATIAEARKSVAVVEAAQAAAQTGTEPH